MNTIVLSQDSFGLIPKIFNAVDVVFSFGKVRRVVDAFMVEPTHIKRIVRTVGISADNAIRLDFTGNNGHQGTSLGVVDHRRADLSMTFEDAKRQPPSPQPPTSLSLPPATKLAFIQLNAAFKHFSTLVLQMVSNHLPNFLVKKAAVFG